MTNYKKKILSRNFNSPNLGTIETLTMMRMLSSQFMLLFCVRPIKLYNQIIAKI